MSIKVDDLRKIPLFAEFGEDVLNELTDVAYDVVIPPAQGKSVILEPTQQLVYIFVVIAGDVQAVWYPPAGSKLPRAGWSRLLSPGDVPCHSEILLNRLCTTRVTAEPQAHLIGFPLRTFSRLITKYPVLYDKLLPLKRINRLRAMPLLMNVPDALLLWLADFIITQEVAAGEMLPNDVEHPTLWMVDSGQLQIWPTLTQPEREILVGPGFYFPDTPFVVGHFRTVYSAQAKVATRLLGIPMEVVEYLLRYLPTLAHRLYDVDVTLPPPHIDAAAHILPDEGVQPTAAKRPPETPPAVQQVNLLDMIRHTSVFADYPEEALQFLTGFFVWQYIPQDLTVVAQGSRDHALHILVEGNAVVRSLDALGRARPRSYMSPGDAIGLDRLLHDTPYDVSVETAVPSTWLTIHFQDLEKANLIWQQRHRRRGWRHKTAAVKDLWQMLRVPPALSFAATPQKKQSTGKRWWHLRNNETIIWQGRAHFIFLLTKLLNIFVMIGTLLLLIWFVTVVGRAKLPPWFWIWLGSVLAFAFMGLSVAKIIDYYNDTSLLTDQRVLSINRTLLMADRRQEVALDKVQDINVDIDFAGQIFDFGTVRIDTAATQGSVLFKNIPRPNIVAGEIRAQRATIRAQQVAMRQEAVREELTQRIKAILLPAAPQQVIPNQWQPSNYYPAPWLRQAWRKIIGAIKWLFGLPGRMVCGVFDFLTKLWQLFLWLPTWLVARVQGKKPPLLGQRIATKKAAKKPTRRRPWRLFSTSWQEGGTYYWRKTYINLWERAGKWFILFITLILVDYLVITSISSDKWTVVILAIPTLLSFGRLAWVVDDWGNDLYILTKNEIIDEERTPLLQRASRKSASLGKVQNLSSEMSSFWERLLRYGTVRIQTAAQEGSITFVKVRHPGEIQKIISKRLDEFRRAQAKQEAEEQRHIILEGIQVYDEMRFGQGDKPGQP